MTILSVDENAEERGSPAAEYLMRARPHLSRLLGKWTGVVRYFPDFEWSEESFIYNLFRGYESIFGRRWGIKAEASCAPIFDEEDRIVGVTYQFHSWEALLVNAEQVVRNLFTLPKFKVVRVMIPVFAPAGNFRLPNPSSPYLFAIAFDTSNAGASAINNPTWSYTVTGANPCLVVSARASGASTIQSASYNSVALSKWKAVAPQAGVVAGVEIWALLNPATGSSLTVSVTGQNDGCRGMCASYSGVAQTGQPDSSASTDYTSNQTLFTATTTVVLPNCWLVGGSNDNVGSGETGGSGTTQRQAAGGLTISDSNGTVGTGSQSLNTNIGTGRGSIIAVSMAPALPVTDTISVTDSSAVSDTPTIQEVDNISVTDSTAVSDTPTIRTFSFVNVTDSTAVSDTPTIRTISNVSVTDSSAVSDTPTIQMFSFVSVTDSTAVSDTPTVLIPILVISVSDSTTVTDTPTIEEISYINVSDSTVVSDTPTLSPKSYVSVTDSTAVGDTPTIEVFSFVSVTDSTAVTDTPTVEIVKQVSVSDSTAVSDTPTIEIISYVSVQDSTVVSDVPTILIPTLFISVSDSTAVSDVSTMREVSYISVSDSTAVSDSPALSIVVSAAVSDTTAVTDSPTVEIVSYVSVTDSTPVSDTPAISVRTFVSVQDSTAVSDVLEIETIEEGVVVQDSTAVSDSPTLRVITTISVQDTVTVTDSASVRRPPGVKYIVLQLGFQFADYTLIADA